MKKPATSRSAVMWTAPEAVGMMSVAVETGGVEVGGGDSVDQHNYYRVAMRARQRDPLSAHWRMARTRPTQVP